MATVLTNKINATDRDVTGPTEQGQITFPLKDKKLILININIITCMYMTVTCIIKKLEVDHLYFLSTLHLIIQYYT